MEHLFIGGVAHGRVLNVAEGSTGIYLPVDKFDPVEPRVSLREFTERSVERQLYELRHYRFGRHIEREVFVRSNLSNDEVLSKYSKLIFQ